MAADINGIVTIRRHARQRGPSGSTAVFVAVVVLLALLASAVAAAASAPLSHARAHAAVVDGKPAQAGSYPWVAHITYARPHSTDLASCTGTVIAPTLVLTAGHCAVNMHSNVTFLASGYRVTTGALDLQEPGGQDSAVIRVIPCPCFDPVTLTGDAAILRLAAPVSAPPVALATEAPMGLQEALIAGYGILSGDSHQISEQLMYARTTLRPAEFCAGHATPFNAYDELCTQSPRAHPTGICKGDSGGPLLVEDIAGQPVEVGITSHGYQRCSTTTPSVYTSIAPLARWLHGWIAAVGSPSSADSIPIPRLPGILTLASSRASLQHEQIALTFACTNPTGACHSHPEIALRYRTTSTVTRNGYTRTTRRDRRLVVLSHGVDLPARSRERLRVRLTAGQARLLRDIAPHLQMRVQGHNVFPAVLTLTS